MRINGKLSRIICLVLVVAMAVALAFTLTTSAADGITFVAPEGVTVGDGSADSLPEASSYNDYEFVGWSEEKVVDTTDVPTIYAAGTKYTGTVTMLYAVYSYEGEAEGAGFVLKNIAEIQNTDVVVIVSNKSGTRYAMSNDNGTSKAPVAVSVTSDGSKLTSTVADNVKWNIEKSGDSYIIHPNGSTTTWLYSTAANNGTRVGNNAAKTWTLDASGYFKHAGTNRYLGVYNGQDWRSYTNTTGNTAGQTFELYV